MKIKGIVCAALAGTMLLGTTALAKDNIYAYNKFISTIYGPQVGYCDISASYAGHNEENVNDYFSGIISAFYDDIDADFDNELVTVDTHCVTAHQMGENGVMFLGSADADLIAEYGDSYANVFTVQAGKKKFIGIETYGKVVNNYNLWFYELDAETDEFSKILEVKREDNEDGISETVWAVGKAYFEYTKGGGITSSRNPENYTDCAAAAVAAIKNLTSDITVDEEALRNRIKGTLTGDDYRFYAAGTELKTYIRATGIKLTDTPVVYFEDKSQLGELKVVPELVTVILDGDVLQFPTQDPVIKDGRTLVPMRTIFEALGATVDWKDENGVQSITAQKDGTTINMIIDSPAFFVNGESKTLDVTPQLINDKTMVPIRAISESLGCAVDWEQESRTVIIRSAVETPAPAVETPVQAEETTAPTIPAADTTAPSEQAPAPVEETPAE